MSLITSYYAKGGELRRRGVPIGGWTYFMDENFNDWTSGSPTVAPSTSYWDQRMGMGTGSGGAGGSPSNQRHVRLIDLGGGDKCLRFILPANGVPTDKGTTMWAQFPRTVLEAVLEYDVRFAHDFNPWGWGGKLPGLGGVAPGTAASFPSGGNGPSISTGWSARLMWVGRASNGTTSYTTELGSRSNRGMAYTYGYDGQEQYGDNLWFTPSGDSFVSGQWHAVRLHARMNSLGQPNGHLSCQIDGVTVYSTDTWMPRNVNADVRIGHLWMHIFRGGDTASWSVATEEYVDINNMRISVPPGA